MDGFKNSTKTHYMKGGACESYAKGGKVKGAAKIAKVMGEFKAGTLHSGSKKGPEVTNPKQAVAIALSEARKAGAKIPKKNRGGMMDEPISTRPVDRRGRRITMAELEQSNRDVGGMSERAVRAAGEAIARGNRMAVEEGKERRLVGRRATPRSREVTVEDARSYSRAEPTRGPAGAGFSVTPLIGKARKMLGFKHGGLSAMPKGKC